MSDATFVETVAVTYNQTYQVDISEYDYIILKRSHPQVGTGTKGKYRLLV